MRKLVPGVLLLVLSLASAASADVTIRMKETRGLLDKKPHVSSGSVVLNANCMATRWEDPTDRDRSRMIFRGDKDLMWIVDDGKKSYTTMDKASIDRMAAQMADAKAQMQARLAQMPAAQRAQAEAMMKKYSPASTASAVDYRRTAQTRLIAGQLCTRYDMYYGNALESYLWVAPYSAMKLSPSDAAVFKKMSDFFSKMTTSLGGKKQDFMPMNELGGVPLLTQTVDKGKVVSETLIESVSRGPVAFGSFDLPAGYKAQATPEMGRHK